MPESQPAPRWRLFTALSPSAEAVEHLDRALDTVREEPSAGGEETGIRWLPSDLWHVTLVFLGWLDPGHVEAVSRAGSRAAGESLPFEWRLSSAGGFPSSAAARVLWMGVEADRNRLQRLFRAVRREMRAVRVPVERRPYQPHLTVARVRRSQGAARPRTAEVVSSLQDYRGPAQQAERVVLMRSHPSHRTVYETLAAWPLGSAAGQTPPEENGSASQSQP